MVAVSRFSSFVVLSSRRVTALPLVALAALIFLAPARAQMTVNVTVVTHGSAHLSWSPGEARTGPGARISSWDIYRAPGASGPFAFIASVSGSTTSYTDATVVAGRKYFYRVTAINAVGMESSPSSIVVAIVPPATQRKLAGIAVGLWPANLQPPGAPAKDTAAVELGLRFTSDLPGYVVGLRFYKDAPNKGPHTGTLWSPGGQVLATGTFADEKPSGWQTLMFSDPVLIQPRTTYVVSYHTTAGQYAYDEGYFTAGHDHPPLHAPKNAGVFLYGMGGFPDKSFKATNYWIEPIFLPGQ
jgi:hypothetical protein